MEGVKSRAELILTSQVLTPDQISSHTGLKTDETRREGRQKDISHSVTFSCVIYTDSERDHNQKVFLPSEQFDLIGAMGANIWAAVYFLGED